MRTSLSNNIALNLPASALDQPLPDDGLTEPLQLSPAPAQQRPGTDQGRRSALGQIQHLRPVDQRCAQHRQLLVRHRPVCAGPGGLADSAVAGDRRGAGVLLHEPVRLHGTENRGAVSGDQPDQFRHPRRADSCTDPGGDRHRLVRNSDVPGVGGVSRAADGGSSRLRRVRPQLDPRPVDPGLGVFRGDLVRATGDPRLRHGNGSPLRSVCRAGDSADRRRPRRVDVLPRPTRPSPGRSANR